MSLWQWQVIEETAKNVDNVVRNGTKRELHESEVSYESETGVTQFDWFSSCWSQ